MNREAVFEQLKIDDGVVYEFYEDHLGYATFGVGHLVTATDPEKGQPLGTPVSEERVRECKNADDIVTHLFPGTKKKQHDPRLMRGCCDDCPPNAVRFNIMAALGPLLGSYRLWYMYRLVRLRSIT